MLKRILLPALCALSLGGLSFGVHAERAPEDLYGRTCMACHASGAAGAARTGDAEAWQTLIEGKGMEHLVKSVTTGLNAMPPRGMCFDCTPGEYEALIQYMASPK